MKEDNSLLSRAHHGLCIAVERNGAICFNPKYCKGYCHTHYHRIRRLGSVSLPSKTFKKCKFIDCDKESLCKNLCKNHYRQHIRKTTRNRCKAEGCIKRSIGKYCSMHYWRLRRYGTLEGSGNKRGNFKSGYTYITPKQYRTCLAKGCGRDSNEFKIVKGLCPKHYRRWHLTGKYED